MTPQLDVIGIVVDDMARSLAFYRELGFELPPEAITRPDSLPVRCQVHSTRSRSASSTGSSA